MGCFVLLRKLMSHMNNVIPHTLFTEYDVYLLKAGNHFKLYNRLGNHQMEVEGITGTYFAVWAPSARSVSVVGNFNQWDNRSHPLLPRQDESGIWEGFIPGVDKGEIYKYNIQAWNGRSLMKGDPYATFWETPPETAPITWNAEYQWNDQDWMKARKEKINSPQPYAVYEVHLGSWKRHLDGRRYTYRELANDLVPYVKEMGFTHVEMMPVAEHPYEPSWGYQITGYFAPTSRFGTPEDFMYLVDQFHQAGIGVILDWVPSHFPTDAHGLADYDGTHLYNHADPRQGFHPDWRTYIFNYGNNGVRNFLISNALFWLEQFHIDGFRVDAVASMLYLDYSRDDGQWIPNKYGGRENLEAIDFLRLFNKTVYQEFPDVVTIAEESTAWAGVSSPVDLGGLGFGQKWMMGWMHDSLKYLKEDPINRKHHHDTLTFSIFYAFSENFMLPLSHDEVVHLKAPLIYKMPGDEWQQFANLRLLYGYMYTHPGTKLLFMGGEFAQTAEWNFEAELKWGLLQYAPHKGMQTWIKKLNHFYKYTTALYEKQFESEGFEWINISDYQNSVIAYLRKGKSVYDQLLVVGNFTPIVRDNYDLHLSFGAEWREVLNSDETKFGGTGQYTNGTIVSKFNDEQNVLTITIPPLAVIAFEPISIIVDKEETD